MTMQHNKVEQFVKRIRQLPTLPTITTTINSALKQPSTSADDLARIIAKDQSLSSKVLKMVNSAYYGTNREITGIRHAVSVLGFNEISKVVLAISVFESLGGNGSNGFNRQAFWIHSLGCAIFSAVIAAEISYPKADDAISAGLMHDIGKVITDRYFPAEMEEVQKLVLRETLLFHEAEQKVMGIDHTQLGEWLLTTWKIPANICAAVRYHHQPYEKREGPGSQELIVDIVHMADVLCHDAKIGDSGNRSAVALHPGHEKRIALSPDRLAEIIATGKEQAENDTSFFQ
jgi:putative nucleotidyltransferase with HDIG domain